MTIRIVDSRLETSLIVQFLPSALVHALYEQIFSAASSFEIGEFALIPLVGKSKH